GASNKAHFPSKRAIQPLWPAYPHASNVPRCSWMSPLHTPFEFSMVPCLYLEALKKVFFDGTSG
ncbi:MAG: hypothetical protein MJA30_12785, partial [Cytophagales bacterium]|nr:hypothetical protein [Cytophagales bacterium]